MRPSSPSTLLLAAALSSLLAQAPARAQGGPPLPVLLRLTTEQASAWRAYRDELALERAEAAQAQAAVEPLNAMTTPQRLDWLLAQLPARAAAARRQAAVTRAFYAVLSPEQKQAFDRLTETPVGPPPRRLPPEPSPGRRLRMPPSQPEPGAPSAADSRPVGEEPARPS